MSSELFDRVLDHFDHQASRIEDELYRPRAVPLSRERRKELKAELNLQYRQMADFVNHWAAQRTPNRRTDG